MISRNSSEKQAEFGRYELAEIIQHHRKRLDITQVIFEQLAPGVEAKCLNMRNILAHIIQVGNTSNQFIYTYSNQTLILDFCRLYGTA